MCDNQLSYQELRMVLKNYIKRRISIEEDAEDLLQETIVKIYNNIDKAKGYNNIYPWIFKIAKNSIIDYYRTRKTSENIEMLDIIEADDYHDDINHNDSMSKCISTIIEKLPTKYKEAIILTEYSGYTQKQMAEKCKISLSAGKSRVQRGKKLIKKMMLECCSMEFDKYGNVVEFKCKNNTYCDL